MGAVSGNIGTALLGVAMTGMILGLASPAGAQDEAALRGAERVGAQLFALDTALQAAEAAGEDVRAYRRNEDITGWIAERSGNDYRFTFVGEDRHGTPIALFEASVGGNGEVLEAPHKVDKSPLEGRRAEQYAARQLAATALYERCAASYTILPLLDEAPGQRNWQMYALPTAAFADVLVVGGSQRIEVTPAGDRVLGVHALAAPGCAVLQNTTEATVLRLDDVPATGPNELFVYLGLRARKPLHVGSWLIREGRIQAATGD